MEGCEFILESFCKETPDSEPNKKIALADSCLVILELQHEEYQPVLLCELNDKLRFQRMRRSANPQSKTAEIYGFHLLNDRGQATTVYLQFASIEELWLNYLAKVLI